MYRYCSSPLYCWPLAGGLPAILNGRSIPKPMAGRNTTVAAASTTGKVDAFTTDALRRIDGERIDFAGGGISAAGERRRHGEHVMRIDAWLRVAEADEGANQQRSAGHQDQRQRHFGHHQRRTEAIVAAAEIGRAHV